jgi:3-oxoadipate enol-lactonase
MVADDDLHSTHGASPLRPLTYRGTDDQPLHAAVVGSSGDPTPTDGGRLLVLLHGGGPDHRSLLPLARRLADGWAVVLPDVRGYGRSVCRDAARHTWGQYADDVVALLDHVGAHRAVVGGTGLGATIALRAALAHPGRVRGLVLISVEEIEDDRAKAAETAFMDAFAERARSDGVEAAWAPFLPALAPVIRALVREAIPRTDAESIAAAAAIGRDRSFHGVDELAAVAVPTLVLPGMDARHPSALAEQLVRVLPHGRLAPGLSADLRTADDLARAFAPAIREFLDSLAEA